MDASRQETIQELLVKTIVLPPTERAKFLADACPDDPELRKEVESLITAHERAGRFLSDPGFLERPIPFSEPLAPDSQIGPYTLVRIMGEGGYGTVYLAEQQHPIKRRVALKVIKAGMDTRQVISRFELERQALALMEHPNIARVLDAGATDTGRPYFVMELVEGEPVTEYCRKESLDLRSRLALFEIICAAVHHAHQKGVIHRDLKPGNILVTIQNGRGVVKIIDFGIAKAVHASLADWTQLTAEPQFLGTPQYMSPEQLGKLAGDIDTRCDVYALGVLLYELLTDRPPFEAERLRAAGYAQMQRIVTETNPPTPSARLLSAAKTTTPGSETADWRKRSQRLRGDLDWVVMKAIEKDRERRYGSAEAFADDIGRYLRNEPALAGRPSRWHKARIFVRRNRIAVIATAAVAIALVIGIAVATAGLVQARRQRDLAVKARAQEAIQRAAAEQARSLALANEAKARDEASRLWDARTFLYQLIAPPFEGDKSAVAPIAVLDYVASRLEDGSLGNHIEAEAPLRFALGNAYFKLEMYPKAERHYRVNLKLSRLLDQGDTPNLASAIHNLASVLVIREDYAHAEPLLRESLAMYRRMNHGDSWVDAPVISNLGVVLANTSRLDEAEPLLRAVIPMFRAYYGDTHEMVARSIDILAEVLAAKGDKTGADALHHEAVELRTRRSRATTRPSSGPA